MFVLSTYSANSVGLVYSMCFSVTGIVTNLITTYKISGPTKPIAEIAPLIPAIANPVQIIYSKNKLGCLDFFHNPP